MSTFKMGGCVNLHISLVTVVLSSFKPLCLDLSLVFFLHVLDMRFSRHLFETDYFGAWKPFVGKKNPLLKVWKPSKNLLFWCVWKGFGRGGFLSSWRHLSLVFCVLLQWRLLRKHARNDAEVCQGCVCGKWQWSPCILFSVTCSVPTCS